MFFFLLPSTASAAETNAAKMSISGYGPLGNLDLKRLLRSLNVRNKRPVYYDANDIEDAALILFSRVKQDGFLKPTIDATLTLRDGRSQQFHWDGDIEPPLTRPTEATKVEFRIQRGILYRYRNLEFSGLQVVTEREAEAFFVERGLLLPLKRSRVFTPQKLNRGLASLLEVYSRRGYENAEIISTNIVQNDVNGQVDVTIGVKEGPKSLLNTIRVERYFGSNAAPQITTIQTNITFSQLWLQDFRQSLRATELHRGYPDTTVEANRINEKTNTNVEFDLLAKVEAGELVKLGSVNFEGEKKTKISMLERRAQLEPGQPLDRIAVEQGRHRLSTLGIFDTVGIRYDVVDPHLRDVTYIVREGKAVEVYLLLGLSSYELLRGGVEVDQYNLFGRAHRARLRLVQSFKSSSADFLYTMPEFFGEDVDYFIRGSYLRRQEISFLREEYGGGTGAKTFFTNIDSEFTARYDYEVLKAADINDVANVGPTNVPVGAITFELKHDMRDNPLNPKTGYNIYSSVELASDYLGGQANYARLLFNVSYHKPIVDGTWVHLNLQQGVIETLHAASEDLPFNKRFFPGGANSVRGFQYGEAAPRNAQGQVIGAETYSIGNVEFEQALTPHFSLVVFSDVIGFSSAVQNYLGDEVLLSVGGGIRWQTIVGPVRLEYGYNPIKRSDDPTGTFQFSIGFPF